MWIYTFGSLVRGEIDAESDIDILCICDSTDRGKLPAYIQKYSKNDYLKIHTEGDLFSHHLYKESCLIHSSDGADFIQSIGRPGPYIDWNSDLLSFIEIARYSLDSINRESHSVFSKGLLYMTLRDMAMIYSHVEMHVSDFSKYVPYNIDIPLDISRSIYENLRLCRLSSTRGTWNPAVLNNLPISFCSKTESWINKITNWSLNHAQEN